jgi:hypothetical protein
MVNTVSICYSFYKCVKLREIVLLGSLFLTGILPQQIMAAGLTLGICVPSSCNRQSIVSLGESLFNKSDITEEHVRCSNDDARKQKSLSRGAIATCVVLSLLGLLVLVGTRDAGNFFFLNPWVTHSPADNSVGGLWVNLNCFSNPWVAGLG